VPCHATINEIQVVDLAEAQAGARVNQHVDSIAIGRAAMIAVMIGRGAIVLIAQLAGLTVKIVAMIVVMIVVIGQLAGLSVIGQLAV